MNQKIKIIVLSAGWFFLALFLLSGYLFNKLSFNPNEDILSSITWDQHLLIFNSAVQCSFVGEDLLERKKILKETIFSKVLKKEKVANGYVYYFNDDSDLLASVFEHVQIEKACCPFFKFDISILPNKGGFALQISGSKEALELIHEFDGTLID